MTGATEVLDHKFTWYYIEEEEKYEQLVESLNPKGVREKKLQENLRKIKNHLKLIKTKKSSSEKSDKIDEEAKQVVVDVDMDMSDEKLTRTANANVDMEENENHIVFETDKYDQSLNHAIWYGKKIPPKRK